MRTNLVRKRATLLVIVAAVVGVGVGYPRYVHSSGTGIVVDQNKMQASHPTDKRSSPGVCERDGEKFVGQKPVRIDRSVRAPKKTRDVRPNYAELLLGTIGSGMWIGEVLINSSGKI